VPAGRFVGVRSVNAGSVLDIGSATSISLSHAPHRRPSRRLTRHLRGESEGAPIRRAVGERTPPHTPPHAPPNAVPACRVPSHDGPTPAVIPSDTWRLSPCGGKDSTGIGPCDAVGRPVVPQSPVMLTDVPLARVDAHAAASNSLHMWPCPSPAVRLLGAVAHRMRKRKGMR
jgi:hypothetical protein